MALATLSSTPVPRNTRINIVGTFAAVGLFYYNWNQSVMYLRHMVLSQLKECNELTSAFLHFTVNHLRTKIAGLLK